MIQETEFLQALQTINRYKAQVIKLHKEAINKVGLQTRCKEWADNHSNMSIRLRNTLKQHSERFVMDITKKEFLSCRIGGKRSWNEFCELTGQQEY